MKKNEFYYVHSFIYDKRKLERLKVEPINFKDDFLVTFDKIFRDINLKTTDKIPAKISVSLKENEKFFISDNKKIFEINIKSAEIYFFPNEIAFFVMKVLPSENLTMEDMYYLNFLLSSFYKFEDKNEIYIASSNGANISIDDFINYKPIDYIIIDKKHNENKCLGKFPFNKKDEEKSDFDKSRVGLLIKEEYDIKDCLKKNSNILHYKSISEIVNKIHNERIKVHYDTFLTGFFIDYVKLNKSFNYYDNFNPLGVNFLFLNANFLLYREELEKEYDDGFVDYEPFLTYSTNKGFVKKNKFYKITQPDSDIVTIGNQNNIINFINDNSECKNEILYCIDTSDNNDNNNVNINKELLIFLYVLFQNVYLLMLTSMFVVDYNKEKSFWISVKRYLGSVSYIDKAIKKYNSFIVNHNFNSIADNPMLNNLYQFFRELREIPIKLSDLKLIVGQYGNLKNIIKNISQSLMVFLLAMLVLLFLLKVLNTSANYFIDGGIQGIKHFFAWIFNKT